MPKTDLLKDEKILKCMFNVHIKWIEHEILNMFYYAVNEICIL